MWPCPPSGPGWAEDKSSEQAPFSSVPGAADLADHGVWEPLGSSEDKAERTVQGNFPATGQCSSLQYDFFQPQFPSL